MHLDVVGFDQLLAVRGHQRHGDINPLLLDDTSENRRFLIDWLSGLVAEPGRELDTSDIARLKDAVDANMEARLARIDTKLAELKSVLVRWMFTFWATTTLGLVALLLRW